MRIEYSFFGIYFGYELESVRRAWKVHGVR